MRITCNIDCYSYCDNILKKYYILPFQSMGTKAVIQDGRTEEDGILHRYCLGNSVAIRECNEVNNLSEKYKYIFFWFLTT